MSPLVLAESAAKAFAEGRIEEARKGFAVALTASGGIANTTDLRVLFLAFQFHFRSGEYDEAERFVRRRLQVCGPDTDPPDTARAETNLGLIHLYRRDFAAAEGEMSSALAIDERIGHEYGIARDLGNLSLIPEERGDYDRAEELLRKSLAIADRIGADHIAANKLANLGDIAKARSRPEEARALWTRATALFARLNNTKHHAEFTRKLAGLDSGGPSGPDRK